MMRLRFCLALSPHSALRLKHERELEKGEGRREGEKEEGGEEGEEVRLEGRKGVRE